MAIRLLGCACIFSRGHLEIIQITRMAPENKTAFREAVIQLNG